MIKRRAFTSLEALSTVFMAGFLIVLLILVVNPQRRLSEVRNSRRIYDAEAILMAINQYIIDHHQTPPGIDGNLRILGTMNSNCNIDCSNGYLVRSGVSNCLDLSSYLVPGYLMDMPKDPLLGTSEVTYYAVRKDNNNRIAVYSCGSELGWNLTITQ